MADNHRHRSGPLKQNNKKHKAGRHDTKTFLTKKSGGKVERAPLKSTKVAVMGTKQQRLQKAKQWKQMKKEDVWNRNRHGGLAGASKIVALVPLGPSADLAAVRTVLVESATTVEYSDDSKQIGRHTNAFFATHKQKLTIIESGHDLVGILDMAKVADVVVFVLPMFDGPDASVSADGDAVLSALRAQGLVATVGVIQGLEKFTGKVESDYRKYGNRFFTTEFGDSIKIAQGNSTVQVLRAVLTAQPKLLHWREIRSYMHAMDVTYVPETQVMHVSGYIRGRPLSVNQLLHLTDIGTFQMSHILAAAENGNEPVVLATADPTKREDLQYEADVDTFAAEQTWPTDEELNEAAANRTEAEFVNGMSSYQSAWNVEDDEDDAAMDADDDDEDDLPDQAFCKVGDGATTEAGGDDDDDDDMSLADDDDAETRQAQLEALQAEHQMFPDEVDVPADSTGKDRFARYRGMKSFRTSPWDAKESLPMDYARLFQFNSFNATQKRVLDEGKAAEDLWKQTRATVLLDGEYVASGTFVTLVLINVPAAAVATRAAINRVCVLSSLLRHENRLSVLNFSLQRHGPAADVPVKSKDQMSFHCGFRRFDGCPIFSDQNLKADKHKFQRFFPTNGWSVASVYGPATFQPASVLVVFQNALVASGTLLNVDPDRIVLKRVVVTGTPVRVKRRKAVIRYMFHSPEDVRWFKPVELTTKHGMTGHIKESLGTHGDFKAIFNKPIKNHDTVCLNLYKRVYPKRVVVA
ncbi:hypothetical protein DYB37_000869 [Aphanomyces astaci]|uniref:Bms1-type G domain-containing protein n=1 Tax=Aphanomyces astaci TaxID=112090 RepID=A0A3R6W8S4_APHAT|nr:hypothetical protein DYB35_000699 [Aphanomyces astaci]RHZ31171.1 hypothetical protein DYB37_000869 [Aphanomyces astaci]